MKQTVICNIYAGAGAGKSTIALLTAGLLKQSGIDCEYVDEWHKMSVWLNHGNVLEHPEMMLANQHQKIWALDGKVDIIVSDCPLLLFAPYAREYIPNFPHAEFEELSLRINNKYQNTNFWVNRDPSIFKQEGRVQTLEQSMIMDDKIRHFVEQHTHFDFDVDNNFECVLNLVEYIKGNICQ
jgi:hypothetical protein